MYDPDLLAQANHRFQSAAEQYQRAEWLDKMQQQRTRNNIDLKRASHDFTIEWRSR
jgi:hypothetical protein